MFAGSDGREKTLYYPDRSLQSGEGERGLKFCETLAPANSLIRGVLLRIPATHHRRTSRSTTAPPSSRTIRNFRPLQHEEMALFPFGRYRTDRRISGRYQDLYAALSAARSRSISASLSLAHT
jgi:hypothetical protein